MINVFKKFSIKLFLFSLPFCGLWFIGQGTYIHAKALLAQVLLEAAWLETRHGIKEVKPWPWADTWPVSRLSVPSLGVSRIVLAGASGQSLAFGPGHLFSSAEPGEQGNVIIAGHRDTHFTFIKNIQQGDQISLQDTLDNEFIYEVFDTSVIHEKNTQALQNHGEHIITLITCYPFASIQTGGPWRYIVRGRLRKSEIDQTTEKEMTYF